MELNIYSRTGALRLTVVPEDNAAESCGVEEQSSLSLSFTSFTCVALEVYDYVDFQGRRYWVTERYVPQMNARKLWAYSLRLGGIEALAAQTLMVNTADADNPEWTLAAPAREHAAMIVANLNRKTGTTEWKVGEVAVTDTIEIDYSGKYASDALTEVADAAKTEWWFDGVTLNFSRCEFGDPVPLAYGDGLLGGISRTTADGVKFFTRLFPLGSTRNIDPDRYGHARLQLPNGAHYVEQDTHLGIVEHYEQEAFEEIYPRRVGTISTTLQREVTGDDGVKYKIYHFDDRSLPFNPNDYELPQKVKQVTFQSGELRGRTFEVNFDPDWDSGMFEIVTQWPYEDKSIQVPGPGLEPKPGDQYVIWNIRMPDEYYPLAEAEYREAVDSFMAENRKDLAVFQAETDFTVIDRRGLDLRPGQRVRLVSAEMFPETGFRDTRIVSISRNVLRPGSMTLRMSDVLATGRISRIESNIASVERITKQVSSEFPDLIRSWEETPSSDTTLYTSRKSDREFLSKRTGGTVDGPVEFRRQVTHDGPDVFREQVTLDQGLRTADFAAGLTGAGGRIDGAGNGELESLFIRRFLEVPQLNYNRVEISVGDSWSAPGGGTIEQVDTETHLATLRLEEGEVGTLRAGDICMGIFHSLDTGENALQDADDSRGNIAFAGFATVYFRVEEVLGEHNEQFRYSLRPVSESFTTSVEPMAAMSVVTYGSFTDPTRRTSMYTTRTYQRYLRNVQTWEYGLEQIAAQFGDLSNLSVHGLQMEGYSAYVDNLYMQGVLRNLTGNFLVDSRTQSLLMASTDSGMGLAFNPEHGLKIGSVYDPETGRFQKEYDLDLIERNASEAQQTVSGLQIGGVNLLDNSETLDHWIKNGSSAVSFQEYQGYTCAVVSNLTSGAPGVYQPIKPIINIGNEYAASVWVYAEQPTTLYLGLEGVSPATYRITEDQINKWVRAISVQKPTSQKNFVFVCYAVLTESSQRVAFRNAQLEEGNKATAWSASSADVKNEMAATAQEKVDDLVVGAVNIVKQGSYGLKDIDSYIVTEIYLHKDLTVGNKYTLVLSGRIGVGQNFVLFNKPSYSGYGTITNISGRIYSLTFTYKKNSPDQETYPNRLSIYNVLSDQSLTRSCDVDWVCLYEGDVKAPYSFVESIYDVKEAIDAAQTAANNLEYLKTVFAKDETVIAGGAVIGSFVGVKSDSGAVVAGLAGKDFLTKSGAATFAADLTCPMFFAGATSATAANSAKFRVYADGSTFAKQMTLESGCIIGRLSIQDDGGFANMNPTTFQFYGSGFWDFRRGNGGVTYLGCTDNFSVTKTSDGKKAGLVLAGNSDTTLAGILINMTASAPAIEIKSGYVRGLRRYKRYVSASTTINATDDVIETTNSTAITITLPASPADGTEFEVWQASSSQVSIRGNGPKFKVAGSGQLIDTYIMNPGSYSAVKIRYCQYWANWLISTI